MLTEIIALLSKTIEYIGINLTKKWGKRSVQWIQQQSAEGN